MCLIREGQDQEIMGSWAFKGVNRRSIFAAEAEADTEATAIQRQRGSGSLNRPQSCQPHSNVAAHAGGVI